MPPSKIDSLNFGNSQLNYIYSIDYLIKNSKQNDFQITFQEKKLLRKFSNHVSNLCSNQKIQGKVAIVTFLKLFLNAMIRNIKIHNIFDIIGISKSMEPNKCTH